MSVKKRIGVDLNREDVAWAAGFFDGEGNVTFSNTDKSRTPRVYLQIAQVRIEPLLKFRSIFPLTEVLGPYSKTGKTNNQPYYKYAVHTFENVQFISATMWEFLTEPKKEDIIRTISSYTEWMKNPECVKGHLMKKVKGKVKMYCLDCSIAAGKKAAATRWGK